MAQPACEIGSRGSNGHGGHDGGGSVVESAEIDPEGPGGKHERRETELQPFVRFDENGLYSLTAQSF